MRIAVTRQSPLDYAFVVEKDKDFEKTDDVIKACLQLERELLVKVDEKKEDE